MGGDVSIDNDASMMTSSILRPDLQSSEDAHMDMMRVYAFTEVSVCAYM
jgi:hypothetical protein